MIRTGASEDLSVMKDVPPLDERRMRTQGPILGHWMIGQEEGDRPSDKLTRGHPDATERRNASPARFT
jgi:hypothetical protein